MRILFHSLVFLTQITSHIFLHFNTVEYIITLQVHEMHTCTVRVVSQVALCSPPPSVLCLTLFTATDPLTLPLQNLGWVDLQLIWEFESLRGDWGELRRIGDWVNKYRRLSWVTTCRRLSWVKKCGRRLRWIKKCGRRLSWVKMGRRLSWTKKCRRLSWIRKCGRRLS